MMNQIFKSKKKWLFLSIGIVIVVILAVYLSLPIIIKSQIHKKIDEVEKENNISLTIGEIKVNHCSLLGNTELDMHNIELKGKDCPDKFLTIDNLHTGIRIWRGLKLTKEIQELDAGQLTLNIIKRGEYNNYSFLHKQNPTEQKRNYCSRFNRLLEMVNRMCPDLLSINKLLINTQIDGEQQNYTLDNVSIKDHHLGGLLTLKPDTERQTQWNIKGQIDKRAKYYSGELIAVAPEALQKTDGTKLKDTDIQLNTATFVMKVKDASNRHVKLHLAGNLDSLQIFHRYIAEEPVCINKVGGDLDIEIFPNKLQMNPTSTLKLNHASIHPFFSYEKNKKSHIILKIEEKKCRASDVFSSLPDGLFTIVPKLKVHGNIDFKLLFDCDFANINKMKFDFDIRSSDNTFGIDSGKQLITKYNKSFEYTFEDTKPGTKKKIEKKVLIDSVKNPYFCPFSKIPTTLTGAILTNEDPSFFRHRGFIKDAIRNAMAADLQAGKLLRGGSTISMQLVKNLFLNRKKIFTRKIEELLLVWMIEDKHLIPKERMFEIYVNIAEWGPEIIGLGEATEFYFHKKPDEITLGESLYMASLIRAPKQYPYTIDNNGIPHAARQKEMRYIAGKMLERGLITGEEYAALDTRIHIYAPKRIEK